MRSSANFVSSQSQGRYLVFDSKKGNAISILASEQSEHQFKG